MKETMWKKHLALLTSTAFTLQFMAFGTVSSLAVTDGDTLTDGIVQTETLTPEEEFSETGTEIHADYLTKVEYDNSPMQVGETRAIRFYHPETLKGGKGSIYEVSDNLSYTYEEGSDTIYITALAEGDAKLYVMAEGCAFGSYVRLTVEAGTTAPTEDYEEIMTTTTETVHADYAGVLEYDDSPMQVGETRAVRFYDPTTGTGRKAYFEAVSDKISYTYEAGSDTFYVTALAEGDASMHVLVSGCAFYSVLRLTVEAGTETPMPGDLDGDNTVNTTDAALLLTAAAQSGAGEQRSIAQTAAADLNGDGAGDAADAALILQYAAYAGTGGTLSVMDFLKDLLT